MTEHVLQVLSALAGRGLHAKTPVVRPLRASWLVSIAVAAVSFGAGYLVFTPKGKPRADGSPPAGTLRGMLAGRFSAAAEDRVAALFAAFDEREPLRRDAAIFRAIEQLQPGDALGALGDLAALIRRVEKLPRELWPHLAEAILERWLALDADAALRWMEGALELGTQHPKAREFFGWDPFSFFRTMEVLARHQPEWAVRTALALPLESEMGGERSQALRELFRELGRREPDRARALLRQIADTAERDHLKVSVQRGMALSDPAAARAFARAEMDPEAVRSGLGTLAFLLSTEASSRDPLSIRQWIEEFSDPSAKTSDTTYALDRLSESDAPFPYDWLTATLDETLTSAPGAAAVLNGDWLDNVCADLAKRDPDQLRGWIESLSGDARVHANASYFPVLTRHDADAAFAWLATLPPDGFGSPDEAQRAFSAVAWSAPEKLDQWIAAQPPGPLRHAASEALAIGLATRAAPKGAIRSDDYTRSFDDEGETAAGLALSVVEKEPVATAAWLATLPVGIHQDRAARTAAEAWTWRDPSAAAEWVESLPAGPLRDSAIAGYAPVAMHADPAAAAASVERIGAPATKQAAAEKVFQVWLGENPIAARRWLRSLAGVESAWVEKTLRSTP